MNELRQILDEMSEIDLRLSTPGTLVSRERDALVGRRRVLESRFDGLQQRPDYLSQVDAYGRTLGGGDVTRPA